MPQGGDITALCGAWGRTPKHDAIVHINGGVHTYYTVSSTGLRANVRVVTRNVRPYLTTAADATGSNNLDNLPPGS